MIDAGEPTPEDGDALVYIGKDDRGVELYIVAVPDDRNPRRADGHPLHTERVAEQEQVMSTDPKRHVVKDGATIKDVDLDKEVVHREDGTRITEADAEKQGTIIARAGRGRPSLSGKATHSPQIGLRVSPPVLARLEMRAKSEGKTVSQIAREAIEHYV